VFENRVLRRIFGPKRNEVTGEWRKMHSGELHNLGVSPNIIRQIKSRRMRWAGRGGTHGGGEKSTRFWWEGPDERGHSEDRGIDDRNWWWAVVNMVMNLQVLAPKS
jgi:hypothetical protein